MTDTLQNNSGEIDWENLSSQDLRDIQTPDILPDGLEYRISKTILDPKRLEAVRRVTLLDTLAEEVFDRFTRLAAKFLEVPVALIGLIDDKRYYFKSQVGLPEPYASARERPLAKSFCQYTIALGHPIVIEDARRHRLTCNSSGAQELEIGGYMGVPLVTSDGYGIGNFCVVDTEPRSWTDGDLDTLQDLAASVLTEIESSALRRELETAREKIREAEQMNRFLGDLPGFTGTDGTAKKASGEGDGSSDEADVPRSKLQFQRLLKKLPAGAFMCNREGMLTYFNDRAVDIWGRTPDLRSPTYRYCGSVKLFLTDGTPVPHEDGYMAMALENDQTFAEKEVVVERPDGSYVTVLAHFSPLHDTSGNVIGGVNVMMDITERKRAKEALKTAKQEAEKMSQMKSNLLANMSHEVRTPLTGILGLAEGLASNVSDEQRERIQLIEKSGRRLMHILNSVMALAQLEGQEVEVSCERLNVTDEVQEAIGALEHLAHEKDLYLRVCSEAPEVAALLDSALLARILNNLVGNAIKFTNEGGVNVRVAADGNNVIIDVADTGVGVDEEFKPRLFEEFRQESCGLSRRHEGIGLGLALTKKMVDLLDGDISLTSQKGKGSTFTLTFPAYASSSCTEKGQAKSNTAAAGSDEGKTDADGATEILLVEDNEIIRRVIVERLQEMDGYEVEAFEQAEPALECARERLFDVLLVDISLPTIDGVEALKKFRSIESYADRPIIATTGYALPGDRERFLEEGFSAYLAKPFSADELLKTIQTLSDRSGS